MSNPATPQRPGRVSSDSTPSSKCSGASPVQLTPRSKVRAMLAAFSDDSEDDGELGPRKTAEVAGTVSEAQYSIARKAIAELSVPESSDSEDISISTKPRGRLVSRMLAGKASSLDDSEEGDPSPVREREKKGGLKTSAHTTKNASSGSPAGSCSDSDVTAAAGPLRRKLTKSFGSYETQTSTPSVRKSSPGLFVSPGPPLDDLSPTRATNTGESNDVEGGSGSDLPENLAANARFMALVERKRQERLAKEAEAARKKQLAQSRRVDSYGQDDDEESGNSAIEERLTQQARPTRKASKKALDEMRRETQRIARNMQLTHEARTKKKITKQSLFEKFNFKPELQDTGNSRVGGGHSSAAQCSSSAAGSDAERVHSTPPTSPGSHNGPSPKPDLKADEICADLSKGKLVATTQAKDSLTAENHVRSSPASPTRRRECSQLALATNGTESSDREHKGASKLDKGKGREVEPPEDSSAMLGISKKAIFTRPPIRVRPPKRIETNGFDSESDLEIVHETKPRKHTVFDKCTKQEERRSDSLHALRLLARLASPGRNNVKVQSITPVELQHDLRRRARQQAVQDREERLQQLRDRGIIPPTAEERAKEAEEIDDLITKAREEAEAIMKREKAAAKKERKEKGEVDPLGESSASEDGDWADNEEQGESELSGSEDEDEDECEEGDTEDDEQLGERDGEEKGDKNPLVAVFVDDEASQDSGSADEVEDIPALKRRKGMRTLIVSDDEGDPSSVAVSCVRMKPNKQIIPGLPVSGEAPLGLTQMFAATMAESQAEGAENDQREQDSLSYLRDLPAPSLPDFDVTGFEDNSQEVIMDSQADRDETKSQDQHSLGPRIDLHYSQSQVEYDSVPLLATQVSEFPDPSQDSGFQKSSPIRKRFATTQPSSPDVPQGPERIAMTEAAESPTVRKRGRLRRRMEVQVFSDGENTGEENEHDEFEIGPNAFDVMRKASKKMLALPDKFDKAKSEAKAMVDEQAQESEDEYAGLGGASSDDESEGGENAAEIMDMIDDDGKTVVNEREIAAFYADKERASDEKQVEKLFKDITNGILRRKRGADYDLSDSDDDLDARRRRKQREFAKMRNALLKDENITTNPKKLAFLRAIEDHDQEEQFDFLDKAVDPSQDLAESQGLTHGSQADAPTSAVEGTKRKSTSGSTSEANDENRPPAPHVRKSKRPSTLVEIRESLNSLIAEPHAAFDVTNTEDLSSDENSHRSPPAKRRRTTISIVDRIAIKRADSTPSLNSETRLFFQDSTSTATTTSLRAPPLLLRRAAASHITLGSAEAAGTERMAGDGVVKRTGGAAGAGAAGGRASSSINYCRREREREKSTLEGKRERKRLLKKQVEGRRGATGGIAGLGAGWKFD
ncbi:hypothetical protein GP486_004753 [Trichoglossum hirsutum]|uniref:DNA replication checkpoint mediator MRC1 domain-containing protein n=1 Tax=Trichoglossum hirsutum TaxID=265104 RepID=A0A9P8LAJ6_9PEZI|nr:hypothetical protein GP486_004753 [Trichoglossum hirsutum]